MKTHVAAACALLFVVAASPRAALPARALPAGVVVLASGAFSPGLISGGRVLLTRSVPANGSGEASAEAWISDGSPAGTFAFGADGQTFRSASWVGTLAGRGLLSTESAGDGVRRLWLAPASGTALEPLTDLVGGAADFGAADLGSRAVFHVRGAAGAAGVWTTDGTPGGTMRLLAETTVAPSFSLRRVFAVGGAAVFFTDDGIHGDEPWRSDGTPEGTSLIADINPGVAGSGFVQGPFGRTERTAELVSGRLVFLAQDGLWITDGTAETTYPFVPQSPNLAQFHPPPVVLVEAGGRVAWRSPQFLGIGSPIVAEVGAPGSPPPTGTFVHVSLPGYMSPPGRFLDEVSAFYPPTPSGAVAGVLAVSGYHWRGRIVAGNWRIDLATLRATRVPPGAVGTLRDPVDEAALGEGTRASVVFRDRRGRDVVTATSGVPRRAVGRRIVFAAGTRVSLVGDAAAGFVAVATPREGEASLVGLPLGR